MSFPRYERYKDSGVDWLGEVPEHWQTHTIKHIVSTPISDGPHETPEFLDEGVPFASAEAVSSGTLDFSKIRGFISREDHKRYGEKYLPRRNDIFMVKSGATTGVTAIVETDAEFNIWSPLAAIRCGLTADPYFVLFYLRSKKFLEAVTLSWSFGTQQNIGMGVIENLCIPLPHIGEQKQIATFLKYEIGKIEKLIGEQRRLIELLKEKCQAVISHAVTKGLNPDAPMKDSGTFWIGKVPQHWDVSSLRYFARFSSGSTPDRMKESYWGGDIPWVKTGEIDYAVINTTEEAISVEGMAESSVTLVPAGSMLLALYGQGVTRGRVAMLGVAATFNQA